MAIETLMHELDNFAIIIMYLNQEFHVYTDVSADVSIHLKTGKCSMQTAFGFSPLK